jgi:glycosyltransferase involved in cell wall biosynthesis
VDEIWVPSRFCAEAFRTTGKPVFVIPHPVEPVPPGPRMLAGVPDDLFLFLAVFVWQDRKNPFGLLRAFRDAFAKRGDVGLLLRLTVRPGEEERVLEQVRKSYESAWQRSAATLFVSLDARSSVDSATMHHLYRRADALVSLHAAEGFGLTMAEGMAAGLPVVATRYSGNLDFMDDDSAFLVDSTLVPVRNALMPVRDFEPHMTWAEPVHAAAVEALRACVDQTELARARAARGQRRVLEQLEPARVGAQMAERLRAYSGSAV